MKTFLKIIKYLGIYFVSFVLIMFATTKFCDTQFEIKNVIRFTQLRDLSPMAHAWSFFGRSYVYQLFIGIAELTAGILILFNRTRLIGLLLAFGIYANILIIDIEFEVKDAVVHTSIEFVIVTLLLIPYAKDLKVFFWNMGGKLSQPTVTSSKLKTFFLPLAFAIIATIFGFLSLKIWVPKKDKLVGVYDISNIILNNDTLKLRQGRHTKLPTLFFELYQQSSFSLNDSLYQGNYSRNGDSIFINLKTSLYKMKNIKGKIDKNFKLIKGITDHKDTIQLVIKRVPDSEMAYY